MPAFMKEALRLQGLEDEPKDKEEE